MSQNKVRIIIGTKNTNIKWAGQFAVGDCNCDKPIRQRKLLYICTYLSLMEQRRYKKEVSMPSFAEVKTKRQDCLVAVILWWFPL